MEKPEEEPGVRNQTRSDVTVRHECFGLPMYLVSPDVLVTREHIISDRASTSSSWPSCCCCCGCCGCCGCCCLLASIDLRFSSSFGGSGDVSALLGVDAPVSCTEVACDGDVGLDGAACEACLDSCLFSASFFSSVPRSVAPSSSPRRPARGGQCATAHVCGLPATTGITGCRGEAVWEQRGKEGVPDRRSRLSMRPRRFSRPSIYLALSDC